MGGGGFGGDGSVDWDVHGDNITRHSSDPVGGNGRHQTGTDKTPEGPLQYFTVKIRLPKDDGQRTDFIKSLQGELASNRDPIVVRLPIEDKEHGGPTPNQIKVDWPSRP